MNDKEKKEQILKAKNIIHNMFSSYIILGGDIDKSELTSVKGSILEVGLLLSILLKREPKLIGAFKAAIRFTETPENDRSENTDNLLKELIEIDPQRVAKIMDDFLCSDVKKKD